VSIGRESWSSPRPVRLHRPSAAWRPPWLPAAVWAATRPMPLGGVPVYTLTAGKITPAED
jgi:hypothetical protein